MSSHDDSTPFPLGAAPRPADAAELSARLRSAFLAELTGAVRGADGVRVEATPDEADIAALSVDLTGLEAEQDATSGSDTAAQTAPRRPQAPVQETLGRVRAASIDAHPVRIEGVPVELEASLSDVPIAWIEDAASQLFVEVREPADGERIGGGATATVPLRDLETALERIASARAGEAGISVSKVSVDANAVTERELRLTGRAKISKGFLGGTVEGTARVRLDDAMIAHVDDVAVGSPNPLVAGLLAFAKGRIERLQGRTFDLNKSLPSWFRLADAAVETSGDRITVHARLS